MFFSEYVEVWGHRGWPRRFPDNVLAGIEAAATVAVRVEIDVRRTRDGRLVLSHDAELGGLVVAETDWSRLSELDLGDGHRPILLQELLDAAPHVALNIEIKNSPFEPSFDHRLQLAGEVAAVCRPVDVISSFHWPTVDRVKELRPELATGLLLTDDVPITDAIAYAVARGHGAVVPHWTGLDASAIERAHDAELDVVTWTVDDPEVAIRLAGHGIDAIITNDPGGIAAALESTPSE